MTSFQIDSAEGLPIRGDIESPDDPRALVVIIHGFKGFKDWGFFPWLAEHLCRQRFAACRFNMSRSGIGEGGDAFDRLDLFRDDTYSGQVSDVVRVARHASRHFRDLPLFLLGHSRGGGIALLAAAQLENLHGVAIWSPIGRADRWKQLLDRSIAFLGCATLLLAFGLVPMINADDPWSVQATVLVGMSGVLAVGGITKVSYIVGGPVDRVAMRLVGDDAERFTWSAGFSQSGLCEPQQFIIHKHILKLMFLNEGLIAF